MVELIHPPDAQALLPPILACLPTAFASTRPPPALLPLLSPILRQRLSVSSDPRDNWLKLLCWNSDKAETLMDNVEKSTFEPHPVSGEVEVGDVQNRYKRLDQETLQCQMQLQEWQFTPIFLWCTGGDEGSGWKLAELLPAPTIDNDSWSSTIEKANETSKEGIVNNALREADAAKSRRNLSMPGNEDDYWAQYDQTPDTTPMRKPSMQVPPSQNSAADYYAQYADVQPAMDNYDPDEEMTNGTETTLNGHGLHTILSEQTEQSSEPPPYQDNRLDDEDDDKKDVEVQQPVPDSPGSKDGSDAIARLESAAETYNASEVGIRQHIGTSIKSMYRLAKSAGMDREEFERVVQRELETLSIFDRDD